MTCSRADNQPGWMSFVTTHEIDTKGTPEHTHASHTLRHSRIHINNVNLNVNFNLFKMGIKEYSMREISFSGESETSGSPISLLEIWFHMISCSIAWTRIQKKKKQWIKEEKIMKKKYVNSNKVRTSILFGCGCFFSRGSRGSFTFLYKQVGF